MCGISGFIDFNKKSSEGILKKMSDTLSHRGPDGDGTFFLETPFSNVGLAHKRLAVIDPGVSGHQPMRTGNLWITYNGEIYNFKEIKLQLEKAGDSFTTKSDTEVILKAYNKWGIDCVHKFIGMFAFVIFDQIKNEITCVRDRTGIKPFFYYFRDDLFLFASELKAFHKHPAFVKELNHDALSAFIQFGNVPAPHCIFNNCFKLKPGHFLKLNIVSRKLEISNYWNVYDYYNQPKLGISFEEAKTETEKLLISAASYRMVSDVPVGIFLSGGVDSTCLAAILQKNFTEKLKTYTIGVKDKSLDEAPYARAIAEHLGTDHHEYYCEEKDALSLILKLPYYYDEPFGDYSAIPTMLVSKIAKKEVTVALSADGGDEIFAGYNRYGYLMKQGNLLKSVPQFARSGLASVLKKISADKIPYFKNHYNFSNRYQKIQLLLKDPSVENIMNRLSQQYSESEIADIFIKKTRILETSFLSKELQPTSYSPLSYMMAIDYQTYLPDDILQKVDRASMSQGLEAREPFLDHRIIEFVARLPDNFKYHKHIKKYILKHITYSYVPRKLLDRPKMGFAVPIDKWLYNDLRDQVSFYLDDLRIKEQAIFNSIFIQNIVSEFYRGKSEHALKIWYFLMFQMWYDEWMK
ncbi:MAG: asparagine synthase (glutamine-hydrolyzing) [Bacteroidetes bacterium]|nr:asparagine synthase (glutamine-hydrolyzing) [Bacteroidota bacterium]